MKKRVCIFASGAGSNAGRIMQYFAEKPDVQVAGVFTNNPKAGVLQIAAQLSVPAFCFERDDLYKNSTVKEMLRNLKADLLVLAGFLWLMPEDLILDYPDRILNIHPALLPKYGGKGMYGKRVHEAVTAAAEEESGITIHLVNEHYDKGRILLQEKVSALNETAESLESHIRELEHRHYPEEIYKYLLSVGKKS